mmetsp:Transcript_5078/g.12122  ORF Transcript_5078/g.12122 Transcript_5078/m.12122 type:complete len:321 (-) Transcript_5078:45-1007(-)
MLFECYRKRHQRLWNRRTVRIPKHHEGWRTKMLWRTKKPSRIVSVPSIRQYPLVTLMHTSYHYYSKSISKTKILKVYLRSLTKSTLSSAMTLRMNSSQRQQLLLLVTSTIPMLSGWPMLSWKRTTTSILSTVIRISAKSATSKRSFGGKITRSEKLETSRGTVLKRRSNFTSGEPVSDARMDIRSLTIPTGSRITTMIGMTAESATSNRCSTPTSCPPFTIPNLTGTPADDSKSQTCAIAWVTPLRTGHQALTSFSLCSRRKSALLQMFASCSIYSCQMGIMFQQTTMTTTTMMTIMKISFFELTMKPSRQSITSTQINR